MSWIAGAAILFGAKWSSRLLITLRVLHCVALLPAASYIFLAITGTSPVAQLSGSSSGWSTWFGLWPLLLLIALLSLVAWAFLALAVIVANSRQRFSGWGTCLSGLLLNGLSLLMAGGLMLLLAPDA